MMTMTEMVMVDHHAPVRNSSDPRTARNQRPPFCTVVVLFRSYYIFEAGVLFLQVVADVVDPP